MKRTSILLLAILLTICLVSCTLSRDGGSSTPTATDPVSSIIDSSDASDSSVSTSSDKSSSAASSKPTTPSNSESSSSLLSTSSSTESRPDEPPHNTTPIKPENYYGYSRLSKLQKQAYVKMLEAIGDMPHSYIELGSPADLTERDVYLAAITLRNDHPEAFWLPHGWYIGETHNSQIAILFVNEDSQKNPEGSIESFTATYIVEKAEKQRMERELKAAVNEMKKKVTATDAYGIELQLHDLLCQKVSYSQKVTPLSYTAYGALVNGDAVCEGYTRAMQLLLYEFGISSTVATGDAKGPHMWNLVELGGKWYHLDVTWNDGVKGFRHEYFNLTDPGISRDHKLNNDFENFSSDQVLSGEPFNYKLPVCNATDYYYYSKTGYTYNKDPEKLADYIISSNASVIELIGWDDSSAAAVSASLNKRNFTKKLHFEYDGAWARISIKN